MFSTRINARPHEKQSVPTFSTWETNATHQPVEREIDENYKVALGYCSRRDCLSIPDGIADQLPDGCLFIQFPTTISVWALHCNFDRFRIVLRGSTHNMAGATTAATHICFSNAVCFETLHGLFIVFTRCYVHRRFYILFSVVCTFLGVCLFDAFFEIRCLNVPLFVAFRFLTSFFMSFFVLFWYVLCLARLVFPGELFRCAYLFHLF